MKVPRKGQIIISENGKEYQLLEDTCEKYTEEYSMCTAKVLDMDENKTCFLKFVYSINGHQEGIHNLKREGEFRFYYPYIEHVLDSFWAKDPDKDEIYCVCLEYIQGQDSEEYFSNQWELMEQDNVTQEEYEKEYEKYEKKMFLQMMQLLYGVNYYTNFAAGDPFLHRDLKPKNIMINQDENVVIVDFDYSHVAGSTNTRRMTGSFTLGGSLGYTDPRIKDIFKTFEMPDIKSDIYSIGRIFFYWLNAKHYYDKKEELESVSVGWSYMYGESAYGLERERFVKKRYLGKQYEELLKIIEKMCAKPELRYNNIGDIIKDMRAFFLKYRPDLYVMENEMPLLQENPDRIKNNTRNVRHKILADGESKQGHPLLNHTMRDIKVDDRIIMTVYNLDGIIYYIPYAKDLVRERTGEDFEVQTEDLFTTSGYQIRFWI